MTTPTTTPPDVAAAPPKRRVRLPWLAFALAVAWSFALRYPLILNARAHLDSDLAVDGLTLLEATRGQFRWHYPGTPHIGSAPVLASLPQALIQGATPETLVSGGVVLHALILLSCFLLSWRSDGPRAACWSLVPLTFASTGLVWLSGRITGGHLLSVAMHAGIFIGLHAVLSRPTWPRALAFGIWAGLGLWVDAMALLSLAAAAASLALGIALTKQWRSALRIVPAAALGFAIGASPHWIGKRIEPYDAYKEQFTPIWNRDVLIEHGKLLFKDCLPRLVMGHRIPSLLSDPPSYMIPTAPPRLERDRGGSFDEIPAHFAAILFLAAIIHVVAGKNDPIGLAVRSGLLVASALVIAGFIINRNIFNSDNYRYLVFLIVPWSIGFGRAFDRLQGKGKGGATAAALLGLVFAVVMTIDVANWYGRFNWMDRHRPVKAEVSLPLLRWFDDHPEVTSFMGGYWEVYRYSFLTGGRVRGMPYPVYPNRFPEWSRYWAGDRPAHLVTTGGREGSSMRSQALATGASEIARVGSASVFSWPNPPGDR